MINRHIRFFCSTHNILCPHFLLHFLKSILVRYDSESDIDYLT